MLEIGVSQGGSLDMWRMYFGPAALIVGVDVDDRCKGYEGGKTFVRIGSQDDRIFLGKLAAEFDTFDLIIDDGGHTMIQQITTFEELYPVLRHGGVFITEDVHTSYHAPFGGGYGRTDTFVEFAKKKIDELNGYHIDSERLRFQNFYKNTFGIAFFDSVVVFEKETMPAPRGVQAGNGS
jgi:predicted O-methyltransferase YrrM